MAYTNSPLITYQNISSHRNSPRNHEIDTITIHCYVGQVTAKKGCDYFVTTSRSVSSNYVVGYDGSIGLSVPESDRAWTSGNRENDNRAVTIEVACDTFEPYRVTDKAYEALINLVADICKRNNIKELKWQAEKSLIGKTDRQNMTVHRWFDATACPGEYLFGKHSDIAKKVNAILNSASVEKTDVIYRVQVGAFSKKENAVTQLEKVKKVIEREIPDGKQTEGIDETLKYIKKDKIWFQEELYKKNVKLEDIFYAFPKGQKIYIIKRSDVK